MFERIKISRRRLLGSVAMTIASAHFSSLASAKTGGDVVHASPRGTFRVLMDGHPPGNSHGVDVDEQGNGTAIEQRMYQLIRQAAPIARRLFEIEFLAPGVETFSFTFG